MALTHAVVATTATTSNTLTCKRVGSWSYAGVDRKTGAHVWTDPEADPQYPIVLKAFVETTPSNPMVRCSITLNTWVKTTDGDGNVVRDYATTAWVGFNVPKLAIDPEDILALVAQAAGVLFDTDAPGNVATGVLYLMNDARASLVV